LYRKRVSKLSVSRAYFYGRDGLLEARFEKQESIVSRLLFPASEERLAKLSPEERKMVLRFVCLQRQRTVSTVEYLRRLKQVQVDFLAQKGAALTSEEMTWFEKSQKETVFEAIELADESMSLLDDLELKFLLAPARATCAQNDGRSFIISDSPVGTYNQWAESHPVFSKRSGYKGLTAKGLQWFYPVSPGMTLCIFDPTTYECGSKKTHICRASRRDVGLLNVTVQGETAMLLASSLRRLCGHDSPVRQKRARTALEDGTRAGVFEVVEDASMLLA